MFGGAFAEFKPDAESMQGTMTAIRRLLILISTAQQQGQISDQEDTGFLVSTIWASLHGVIHLYKGGFLGDVKAAHNICNINNGFDVQILVAANKPGRV